MCVCNAFAVTQTQYMHALKDYITISKNSHYKVKQDIYIHYSGFSSRSQQPKILIQLPHGVDKKTRTCMNELRCFTYFMHEADASVYINGSEHLTDNYSSFRLYKI